MVGKILSVMILAALPVHAAEVKPSETFKIKSTLWVEKFKDFGEVRVRADEYGEPVSKPVKIQVAARCGANLEFKDAAKDLGVCKFIGASVDQEAHAIVLHVKEYNPDTSKCANESKKLIPTKEVCGD